MTADVDPTSAPEPVIDVVASRRCQGRLVLDRARLAVEPRTIHAVVGENGAGKTSLVSIAAGTMKPEALEVRRAPRSLGLVPQHGALVPTLSVVENAVLGREPVRRGLLDLGAVAERLRAVGAEYGLGVDPYAIAEELSVGEQQRAEIVIALWRGAELLVLDEPTAVLAPVEVEGLFAVLRKHVAGGGAVVLVTHKLDEVVAIADAVTVLRAGHVVETHRAPLDAVRIARAMVGGDPPGRGVPSPAPPAAPPVLVVRAPVELQVGPGEIVGIAGVEGNGQRELVQAIVAANRGPGFGHIPEDRQVEGLLLDASIEDNVALGRHRSRSGRRGELGGFFLDRRRKRALAERVVRELDVRPTDVTRAARTLSGGNQQKVVVGRELTRPDLRVLVAAQPTRGVDIAAQALIHDRLRAAAASGTGVLVVSADLDELLALCHRIVVLHRGRIAGELGGAALRAPQARGRLGALMTGAAA